MNSEIIRFLLFMKIATRNCGTWFTSYAIDEFVCFS